MLPGRWGRTLVVAVAAATLLVGCTSSGEVGLPGLREAADGAFVSGDSTVEVIAPQDRGDPVTGLAGPTVDGEQFDVADLAGGLVVLNVWGSWCAPCHEEAPDLVAAATEGSRMLMPTNLAPVLGPSSASAAAGFEEEYGIGWPSFHDPDSQLLLRLASDVPPNAVPATLVLDPQGRVAARMLGRVETATLIGVVEDVAAATEAAP